MALYMETTKIAAEKTAAEISNLLAMAGAQQVMTDYENGQATGLTFAMDVGGNRIGFKLPVRTGAVFVALNKKRSPKTRDKMSGSDHEQAHRVAWRQVLKWVQAQLALIETGMVKTQEVFMPYACLGNGQTLYEKLEATKFKALPAPE